MPNPRVTRVAERIHEIVASMVTSKLKDPRLNLVTITDVRVTGDLQHATIFYTAYGSENELRTAGRGLNAAKGLIRSQIGAGLGLRLTPTIEFVADALPETARSFEDALTATKFRDQEITKASAGAQWAGEADPYKSSEESAEEASTEEASTDSEEGSADGDE
ncbi:30S ribosome-binding factor RbfA [Changpingibacter yushuensis]|uniref:30S ribosome-binding factor RbfA n=1 Tax=Changpingibacter yushuensis TaxID=2758440 RepID=UPI0015F62D81|nr:30S ribosome-binding factor RbfA [Changpingibacter yushuensis]